MKIRITLDSHEIREKVSEDGVVTHVEIPSTTNFSLSEEAEGNVKLQLGYNETLMDKIELEDLKDAIEMFLGRMK